MSTCKRAFCASWACFWPHFPLLAPLGYGTTQCHLQDIPLRGTRLSHVALSRLVSQSSWSQTLNVTP